MSDNIDYTFQASSASQADDFFDFAAASGEYDDSGPSNAALTWATPNSPWNEGWDDFSMANMHHEAVPKQSSDTFTIANSGRSTRAPTLYQQQPVSYPPASYGLTHEPNIWDSGSSIALNNASLNNSSALMEPLDCFQPDPFAHTALTSSQQHMDDQLSQGGSMVWALPSDGRQSELDMWTAGAGNNDVSQPTMTSHQPVDDRSAPEILEANALQPVTRCPWQNCVADTFQDEDRAKSHLESHQNALLQSWKGPTTCSWPKCSSSRVFKEKYLLRRHLQNIHVEPLRCPIKGCSYSDPFDKQHDLNRHVKSIHETSRFLCPIESCDSNTIGFSRKDKLVKHMREEHDNVRCLLNHCGASIPDGQQDSHLQDSHGDYECALMACSDALPSHFTKEGARLHLISAHKIYRETAGLLIKEVTSDHVIYNSGSARRETVQCQSCYDLLPK